MWLNLTRHLRNIKGLHVLTLHICCTLSIVASLFIQEILFSTAQYQGGRNSPGVIPDFDCTHPLKQAYPGQNVPGAQEGGLRALKKTSPSKPVLLLKGV